MEPAPLKTFIIYARADAQFKDELLKHLHPFVRNGLFERWVDSDLLPGEEWEKRIEKELDTAHLVIMLVSADALYSDFIEKKELKIALEKKQAGAARVVPILVRDCLWEDSSLSTLQFLPKDENGTIRGVESWTSHDSAWAYCLRELKKLVNEIRAVLQKEMEAVEAARIAEELKKQQSVEAEKAERSRYRLDEAFWKKTSERLPATADAHEKIILLESYLQNQANQNYREKAEEEIEDLRADIEAERKVAEARERREAERGQQEQEAARLVEQTLQDEIEHEKRQKAERLQKRDEVDWKATLEAIEMVKTGQEKIYFLEKYLDEPGHKIYRLEAEKQLGILQAAETARRFEEKQRLEAERKKRIAEQAKKDQEAKEAADKAEQERERLKNEATAKVEEERLEKEATNKESTSFSGIPNKGIPRPAMVSVKGGTFEMGDVMNDKELTEEKVHSVTIQGFIIGKTQVTFEEYDRFCSVTKWDKPNDQSWGRGKGPVINVSWEDCITYCNWLSKEHGLQVVYSGQGANITANWSANGYRLPTEAEWEYAARGGGKKVRFSNGKDIAYPKRINFNGTTDYKKNYSVAGEYRAKTVPVGSLNSPNALGLHDMSGNVWEWCWDWHEENYYNNSPVKDPKGPDVGQYRVLRGGSWISGPLQCRSSFRNWHSPDNCNFSIGFRLVRY